MASAAAPERPGTASDSIHRQRRCRHPNHQHPGYRAYDLGGQLGDGQHEKGERLTATGHHETLQRDLSRRQGVELFDGELIVDPQRERQSDTDTMRGQDLRDWIRP
ncbi:hypothetical protein A4X06_0g5634 [Tilletia controversa]|uniref:Uncharacterized protein n=1 Tax=Tilletia controversa TaxID=13291 RepID=A0A8X7MR06_9BASI|nr:hypothetical protein CF328_g6750 [Tilletia controversa]KAE8245523.1 hypothetical protein A4X06_0g5634 [Tilletia controversa]